MTFRNAKKLHSEDEVVVKHTNKIVTVLRVYLAEGGKYVLLDCDDGETYSHNEVM